MKSHYENAVELCSPFSGASENLLKNEYFEYFEQFAVFCVVEVKG